MKKLKGKCKKCYGCNLLENETFEGTNKCKHFLKAKNNWFIIIKIIIEILIIILMLYKFYLFLSIKAGN